MRRENKQKSKCQQVFSLSAYFNIANSIKLSPFYDISLNGERSLVESPVISNDMNISFPFFHASLSRLTF